MRITKVNNCNFRGLWEPILTKVSHDSEGFKVYENTKLYHPFADETEQQANEVRRINTKKYKQDGFSQYDRYINDSKCYIKEKLPFTLAEWKMYRKDYTKLLPETITRIEAALKKFNLSKI